MVPLSGRTRTARRKPTVAAPPEAQVAEGKEDYYLFDPGYMPPRQYVNPIIGLNPRAAVQLILNGQYGYKADQQWTYAAIERKEPTLRALKDRRLSAMKKLRWIIRVKDTAHDGGKNKPVTPAQQGEIDAQTEILRAVYGRIRNLTQAISFLALATFRGYAHLEKHVDDEGWLTRLEPVPQWYWAQTYPVRDWLFNVQALNINAGSAIVPEAWVVREVDDPLDEIAIMVFLRKNLSRKAWDIFVETFGVPSLFAQFSKETVRPNDLTAAMDVINRVLSAGRGAMPYGVELVSTSKVVGDGSTHPFRPHLDYANEELVIAGTGGKLTMLSDATGIGAGASPAHEAVFSDIALSEGEDICEVLREQVDRPELNRRGFAEPLVEFALEVLEPEDKLKNAEILGAISAAGYRTSDEQAGEMLEMEVHSVMNQSFGGDIYGEDGPPSDEDGPSVAEGGDPGKTTTDEDDASYRPPSAGNRQYFDAPGSQPPAAPFYEAERLHPDRRDQAQQLDMITRPYTPISYTRSAANPDAPQAMTTYPTSEGQDRYLRTMRKALRKYQRAFARGVSKDLEPLRQRIKSILALDNPDEVAEKLSALQSELPSYLAKGKDSEAAKAIESALRESSRRGAAVKV